jgi:hypothetical protein
MAEWWYNPGDEIVKIPSHRIRMNAVYSINMIVANVLKTKGFNNRDKDLEFLMVVLGFIS